MLAVVFGQTNSMMLSAPEGSPLCGVKQYPAHAPASGSPGRTRRAAWCSLRRRDMSSATFCAHSISSGESPNAGTWRFTSSTCPHSTSLIEMRMPSGPSGSNGSTSHS